MHDKYKKAWVDLQKVLCDTSVTAYDYQEALEEMISELEIQLEASQEADGAGED